MHIHIKFNLLRLFIFFFEVLNFFLLLHATIVTRQKKLALHLKPASVCNEAKIRCNYSIYNQW